MIKKVGGLVIFKNIKNHMKSVSNMGKSDLLFWSFFFGTPLNKQCENTKDIFWQFRKPLACQKAFTSILLDYELTVRECFFFKWNELHKTKFFCPANEERISFVVETHKGVLVVHI